MRAADGPRPGEHWVTQTRDHHGHVQEVLRASATTVVVKTVWPRSGGHKHKPRTVPVGRFLKMNVKKGEA